AVLQESVCGPRAKLHLRNARLPLLDCGKTHQKTGKRGARAVVCAGSRGVAASELVVAAILEEAPHGPDIVAETSAKLEAVATALPVERIAALDRSVPGARSEEPSCRERVKI